MRDTIALCLLCALVGPPLATSADVVCEGEDQSGVEVRQSEYIKNNKFDHGTGVRFRIGTDTNVHGWQATIVSFNNASCTRNDAQSVDFQASDGDVPRNQKFEADVTFWEDESNTLWHDQVEWDGYDDAGAAIAWVKAVPNHGWRLGPPIASGGQFLHHLTFESRELAQAITFTAVQYTALAERVNDPKAVTYTGSVPGFVLLPGQATTIPIPTPDPFIGKHIYFKYGLMDGPDVVFEAHADHPVIGYASLPASGGPWLLLAGLLLVLSGAAGLAARRWRAD